MKAAARQSVDEEAPPLVQGLRQAVQGLEGNVDVITTGEQRNKSVMLETLFNVFQIIAKNPAILQDPTLARIFNQMVEMAGVSPVFFQRAARPACPPLPPLSYRASRYCCMNPTKEQREQIKAFIANEPMAAIVKSVLFDAISSQGFHRFVVDLDRKMPNVEYGEQVKARAEAADLLEKGFAQLQRLASSAEGVQSQQNEARVDPCVFSRPAKPAGSGRSENTHGSMTLLILGGYRDRRNNPPYGR